MNNHSYTQKVAEYYYNLGREYALKQASPILDAIAASNDAYNAATDEKKVGKDPSAAKRIGAGGQEYLTSLAKNVLDPRLPKNESTRDALINTTSDLASIVTDPVKSPMAVVRTAQRYGKMLDSTTKSMQKRFNKGGIER